MAFKQSRAGSLTSLAGLVLVAMIINAAIAYLGLRHVDKRYSTQLQRTHALSDASDDAREAQVHFKIQVQEWKNVLLRGRDPDDFARHRKAMVNEAELVQQALRRLNDKTAGLGLNAETTGARSLASQHQALLTQYLGQIDAWPAGTRADATPLDKAVRGIDRQLNTDIDQLANRLNEIAVAERKAAAERARDTLQTTQQSMVGGTVLAALILMVLLALASRRA